jgi:hypothetical protein
MIKKAYKMPNLMVGTVKKSIAAIVSRWLRRNAIQRLAGGDPTLRREHIHQLGASHAYTNCFH